MRKSWKTTLVTTLTTAFSLIALMFSAIPALRLFGIFMAMLAFINWVLVVLMFPCFLVIHVTYVDRFDSWLVRKLTVYNKIKGFLKSLNKRLFGKCLELRPVKTVTDENSHSKKFRTFSMLDGFLYQTWAEWLYKFRWFVVIFFLIIFGGAVFCVTQIQRSDRGLPRFFPQGSNLQQFLDWQFEGKFDRSYSFFRYGCPIIGQLKDRCGVCGGDGSSCPTVKK